MSFDLRALGRVLDFVNVKTDDLGTGFSAVSTSNAPVRVLPLERREPGEVGGRVVGHHALPFSMVENA